MRDHMKERVVDISVHVSNTGCTVREAARVFKVSKSTVHKDITERVLQLNPVLAQKTRKVLNKNTEERHFRGGNATKRKFREN